MRITVASDPIGFGALIIDHNVTSDTDDNYQGLNVPPVTLELTDVNADLQTLELRRVAGGDPVSLEQVGVADPAVGFAPTVLEYSAEVSFGDGQVFLTATPEVTEILVVDGETVQNTAEVRLFRRLDSAQCACASRR